MRDIDILLVEDNPADLELTLYELERHQLGNKIHVARDGQAALDFLSRAGDEAGSAWSLPRLVLLDLKLPKLNGLEVLAAIRADQRTAMLPVVMFSSSREVSDVCESYRLHANSYIQKPVLFAEFRRVIEELGVYWLLVNERPPL
jgi:CheY-like chemotaxis protein